MSHDDHIVSQTPTKSQGFTLIEVMITLVILSFGLLALSALMIRSVQNTTNALHIFHASNQAYDLADRIRANLDGTYNFASGTGTNPPNCLSENDGCTAAQMVSVDRFEWNTTNAAVLPGGTGGVSVASGVYTITVSWDLDRDGAADDSFVFTVRP